jgi:hypothetical protein
MGKTHRSGKTQIRAIGRKQGKPTGEKPPFLMGALKMEPVLQCGEAPRGETQYLGDNKHHCLETRKKHNKSAATVSYELGHRLNCINYTYF